MKTATTLFFLFTGIAVQAQKPKPHFFTKEFRVITDNDAYLLKRKDGYYTNGIFLQYNWVSQQKRKTIRTIELGQRMYTSRHHFMNSLAEYDRPFAGFLYGKFQQTQFSARDGVLRWSASVGTIGSAALAKELQTNYHRLISIYKTYGWDVQVKNEIGLNGSLTWVPTLLKTKSKQMFAINPVFTANLGNTFTNAEIGALMKFGWFEKNAHSVMWNASLENSNTVDKRNFELFLFFHPQLIASAYNATAQGGLFRQDKGIFTSEIYPLMYRHRLGLHFVRGKITIGGDVVFETKETKTQKAFQRYGTLHMGYRFN